MDAIRKFLNNLLLFWSGADQEVLKKMTSELDRFVVLGVLSLVASLLSAMVLAFSFGQFPEVSFESFFIFSGATVFFSFIWRGYFIFFGSSRFEGKVSNREVFGAVFVVLLNFFLISNLMVEQYGRDLFLYPKFYMLLLALNLPLFFHLLGKPSAYYAFLEKEYRKNILVEAAEIVELNEKFESPKV